MSSQPPPPPPPPSPHPHPHPPLPGDTPPGKPAPSDTLQALLSGLIDYAGLYPPAKLPMPQAVQNYAAHLRSPQAWMLGRFICPVSRLEELKQTAGALLPRGDESEEHLAEPWPISAIIDGDLDEDLDAVFAFNHEHCEPRNGLANVDAVEIKATSFAMIDAALETMPEEIFPFFEIPIEPGGTGPGADMRGFIAALSGSDAGAKLRSGGVTAGAFPSPAQVAEFIIACDAADVPFKATAGLHHPLRSEHPLTYEPDCPRALMHGFLNVFLAAAFVREGNMVSPDVVALLEETDVKRFRFSDASACWRNRQLEVSHVAGARESFALSYGSCSFEEPVADLKILGLL
ncbi:MAG: hypothetical protein H7Y88_07325 [Phycisphaerales bacterium]|nr:hypothetical protein [Phycisphaerales bacterium]